MVKSAGMKKSVILIDGECNFCNKTAAFVIRFDKYDNFRFASQQSEIGKKLLREFDYTDTVVNTIILLKDKKVYIKSSALIEIARQLVGLPKLFICFNIIPAGIRDFLYDLFSKYRYLLFGRSKQCSNPSVKERQKFLS